MKETQGFTLIELLVVIAIIGLLATMAVVSFSGAQKKARDAKRKADLAQIAKAAELFFDETGSYPREGCNPDASNVDATCVLGSSSTWHTLGLAGDFLGHNISEFINLPVDPINDASHYYQYEPHCDQGSNVKWGFWVRTILEETGGWYVVTGGIQNTDPNCATLCPGSGGCN